MLTIENEEPIKTDEIQNLQKVFQNKHPLHAWYKHDLNTGHMSYDEYPALVHHENKEQMISLRKWAFSKQRQCLFCGGKIRTKKRQDSMVLDSHTAS